MPLFGALLLLLPALAPAQAPLQPLPSELPCRYGVIGLRAELAAPETLRVRGAVPGGPAARAGLRPGDLLLGGLPYRLRTPGELSRFVQSQSPGDSVVLAMRRQGAELLLAVEVTDRRRLFSFMGELQRPPPRLPPPGRRDPLEEEVLDLIARCGAQPGMDRLLAALAAEDRSYGADCRLRLPRQALLRPLSAWQLAQDLRAAAARQDLDSLLAGAAAALDLSLPHQAPPTAPAHPDSLLDHLAPFFRAGHLADLALAGLNSSAQRELAAQAPALLAQLARYPGPDLVDSTQDAQLRRALGLAKQVDLALLFSAARELASLGAPERLEALARCASRQPPLPPPNPEGIEGGLLFARPSPWGWLLVGGKGANRYRGQVALAIDLGGDDTYDLSAPARVGLCLDYGGDDQYLGPMAGAIAGVSLCLDLEGNDQYQTDQLGQGAAFCGVGMLVDRRGDDQYRAGEYAQGAALFGAGLLLDQRGSDEYAAAQRSQGFGGVRGLGLLRDGEGHDQYLADLRVPSSYGDPGLYEGWSQGVGCGVRGYGEGGIGLLLDQAGDDQYQGGNFSQGVGYFFGLGILVDQRGNDTYQGSRYAQGAAVHQAAGVLADLGGDDQYQSRVAAGQGSGWDAAAGLLLDQEGDDQYRADDLSQGAGAMNGLGLLLDQGGNDTYQARSGQGAGGSLEYWGGRQAPNLGVLMDRGGRDTYNLPGRRDGAAFGNPELGLFEDR
jgi:hypothetical protein